MTDESMARRARSFEQGAQNYHRSRPTFPEAVFHDIAETAGHRLQGRVLEIGAGTGLATLPLARLARRIDVVEPSQDMLDVLGPKLVREGLADRVSLRRARFEDVDPADRYDVVVAAQSFHWTDPASRWSRLASLIRPDGVAFLFWNGWSLDPDQCPTRAVAEVYERLGHGLQPDLEDHRSSISWAEDEIAEAPSLRLTAKCTHTWNWNPATADYTGLLATTSQYAVADDDTRDALFTALQTTLGPTAHLRGQTLCLTIRSDG